MSDQRGKLLVVDDDEASRDMVSRRLRRRGYAVATAADGQTALAMIEEKRFDLILLDIMMPGTDGIEVLRTLRQKHSASELPIIMATARTQSDDVVQALKLGANDYVTKPLDFSIVLARVNTQFSLKRATSELRIAHARMKRDLNAAARIQQTFLPACLPETDGAAFAWKHRPCDELAGDALNILRLGDRRVGFYVLDVSGHGVPAALLSVDITRSLSRGAGLLSPAGEPGNDLTRTSPAQTALTLNALYPMEANGGNHFTMVYAVLDLEKHQLRFVSAGHPGPILVRREGGVQLMDVPSWPVGVVDDADYEDTVLQLYPGDRVYVRSDGVDEEVNAAGEAFGSERLSAFLLDRQTIPLQEVLDALVDELIAWRGDEHLSDDVSVLAVEIT